MFQGFSQGTVDFLWGLRLNNQREWFLEHKEEFHQLVDAPVRQLAAQVTGAMQEEFPRLGLEMKVSRIYRDARRLFGRGPYKDHLWFSLRKPGERDSAIPCLYFEVAPQCCAWGVGCYDPTPMTMAKLRARVDRDPRPLSRLARALEKRPEFRLETQPYKRPKGDPGPLLWPWYNSRQLHIERAENCEGIFFEPELFELVLEDFRFLAPYYSWLRQLAYDPIPEHM